jgi:pimeloyl-ACP methyl ester carboxylesterase
MAPTYACSRAATTLTAMTSFAPAEHSGVNRFTSFDGIEIAYYEWGSAGAHPPVVLHHGFVADANLNWVMPGVVAALVAAGRRVIALDARGHGASAKPHDSACYGEGAMSRDLTLLLDLIGAPRVHLAGYSMGAIVSLLTAAADRRVTRLVVGGVGAGVVELGGVDTRAVRREAIAGALLADDASAITDPGAARFRQLADLVGADRQALAACAAMARAESIPLADIGARTLVIAGDADILAVRPQVLADAIGDARALIILGDHLSAVTNTQFAQAIVDFFTEPGDDQPS